MSDDARGDASGRTAGRAILVAVRRSGTPGTLVAAWRRLRLIAGGEGEVEAALGLGDGVAKEALGLCAVPSGEDGFHVAGIEEFTPDDVADNGVFVVVVIERAAHGVSVGGVHDRVGWMDCKVCQGRQAIGGFGTLWTRQAEMSCT